MQSGYPVLGKSEIKRLFCLFIKNIGENLYASMTPVCPLKASSESNYPRFHNGEGSLLFSFQSEKDYTSTAG